MVSKIGVAIGLAVIGIASWIHSLSVSAQLQSWFPGVSAALQSLVVVAPYMLFVGFYIFFFSLFRRPFFALVPTIPVALVLGMLLWA